MKIEMSLVLAPAIAVAVFSPSIVCGLGIRISDQDPIATARGNAFAATADNPSAIYYNPAGITQLEGLNASVGIYGITLGSTYTDPAGVEHDTKDEYGAVPQFYATYGLGELPLAVGVGLYAPYGLGLEWPSTTGFRTLAEEGRLAYVTFNPVLAWRIHPTLSIAAGPTANYGDVKLRRGIGIAPGDQFGFKGDDIAVGFNVGVMWQPVEQWSIGASYRSATTLDFDGRAKTSGLGPFDGSQSATTAGFHFPQNIVAGVSYRPTTNWNIEVNVDWTDWDSLDTVTLKDAMSAPIAQLPFEWSSSFFYEFGVTRYLQSGWRVSAGYIYSENSVPEASFNPAVPDSDRHIFSVGVGRNYEHWRWDAAYQLAYGPSRTINNPLTAANAAANGSYEFISHALTFSIGYHF